MNSLRRFLFPMLLVGLILGLAIGFHSFFMSNFIEPIALLFWAIWRIVTSVNQNIYWTILIILCSVLAIRLLPLDSQSSPGATYKYRFRRPGRVEYWQSLITKGLTSKSESESLRGSMKKLLFSVLAETERSDPKKLGELVESGQVPLPLTIRRLLISAADEHEDNHGKDSSHPLKLLLWGLWQRLRNEGPEDEASISEILSWMESRMEITHDK